MQTLPVPEAASRAAAGETGAADPARFHHSLSFGLDYKRNHQVVTLPSTATGSDGAAAAPTLEETATAHYPLSATYSLLWETGRWTTEFNTGATLHVRGLGNGDTAFNDSRYRADGGYFYYRADFTETLRLPWDFQAQARLQGQVADRPLLPSEQISVGGLGTVRGYLEAEAAGDHGAFASFELRSPSLAPAGWGEWRLHGFLDWGWVGSKVPLDDETAQTRLLSIGGGTRWQFGRWFSGSLDVGKPVLDGPRTGNDEVRVTFRAGLDY
jgi:hemolysin activation/secretion protein